MGLLNTTHSWNEYNLTNLGSCWENYGMVNRSSFPPGWSNRMAIAGTKLGNWWKNWTATQPGIPWVPSSTVTGHLEHGVVDLAQTADWEIFFPTETVLV